MSEKEVTEDTIKAPNPKEELFCQAYGSAESDTYGNSTKSAEVAGYASPGNAGWKVKQRPHVIARLAELYKENASDIGRVMSDLRVLQLKAEGKGDLATAATCLRLQGQRYALFSEKTIFTDTEQKELTEIEAAEAKRLADIRLREG